MNLRLSGSLQASNPERVGHAIINFTSREAAEAIFPGIAEVLGYWPPWDLGRIQKPVSWAKAQGTAGLQRAFDFVIPVVEGDPSNFHIQDNTAFIFVLPEDNRPGVFSVPVLSPVPTPHTAYSPYSPPQAPRGPRTPPSALVQNEDLDEGEIPPEEMDAALPSVAPQDDSAAFQMPNGLQMRFPGSDGRTGSGDGKGEYSAALLRISHPDDYRRRRIEGGAERDRHRHERNDYRHRDDAYEVRYYCTLPQPPPPPPPQQLLDSLDGSRQFCPKTLAGFQSQQEQFHISHSDTILELLPHKTCPYRHWILVINLCSGLYTFCISDQELLYLKCLLSW